MSYLFLHSFLSEDTSDMQPWMILWWILRLIMQVVSVQRRSRCAWYVWQLVINELTSERAYSVCKDLLGYPASHRRRFVLDCENFKIATKSQFILEANRQRKSIGEKISACRKFFAAFAECPDLIRNRRLSVTKISILFPDRHRWTPMNQERLGFVS